MALNHAAIWQAESHKPDKRASIEELADDETHHALNALMSCAAPKGENNNTCLY